jgi:hypothetical protein
MPLHPQIRSVLLHQGRELQICQRPAPLLHQIKHWSQHQQYQTPATLAQHLAPSQLTHRSSSSLCQTLSLLLNSHQHLMQHKHQMQQGYLQHQQQLTPRRQILLWTHQAPPLVQMPLISFSTR